MTGIELVLKSPTDRIAPFPVQCQPGWTVKQLKHHISATYPGRPPAESQKVIYAGKLLNDDQNIVDIFQPDSSTIVHFICQSSVAAPAEPDPARSKCNELAPDQYPDLYREYQAYVQNFYLSSSSSPCSAQSAAAMGQFQQQMIWMNQAYMHSYAQLVAAQYSQPGYCSTGDDAAAAAAASTFGQQQPQNNIAVASSNSHEMGSPAEDESAVRQRAGRHDDQLPAAAVAGQAPANGAVGAAGAGGAGGPVGAGAGGAVQNMMAAAFDGGDEAGEGDPRDALHYLYVLVRFGLLLLICYYYSSLASVLTTLVLFSLFFGVNLFRRNNNEQQHQQVPALANGVPAPAPAVASDNDNDNSDVAAAAHENDAAMEGAAGRIASDNGSSSSDSLDGTAPAPPAAAQSLPIATSAGAAVTISQRLWQAASTSLQFVTAFFVTLFPEPVAHLELQ